MPPTNPPTDAPVLQGFRLNVDPGANHNRETATSFDLPHRALPSVTTPLNLVPNPPQTPTSTPVSELQAPPLTGFPILTQSPNPKQEPSFLPDLKGFRLADLEDTRGTAISFAAEQLPTGLSSTGPSQRSESRAKPTDFSSTSPSQRANPPGKPIGSASPGASESRSFPGAHESTDVKGPVLKGFRLTPETATSREAAVSFFGVNPPDSPVQSIPLLKATSPSPTPPPESPPNSHPPGARNTVGSPVLRGFRLPNEDASPDPLSRNAAVSFDAPPVPGGSLHQAFGGGSPHRSLLRPVTEEPAEVGLSIVLTTDGPKTPNPRSASFVGPKTPNPGSASPGERAVLHQGERHSGLPRGRLTWNDVINGASNGNRGAEETRVDLAALELAGGPNSAISRQDDWSQQGSDVSRDEERTSTGFSPTGLDRSVVQVDDVRDVRTDDVSADEPEDFSIAWTADVSDVSDSDEVCKRVVVEESDVTEGVRRGARSGEAQGEVTSLAAAECGMNVGGHLARRENMETAVLNRGGNTVGPMQRSGSTERDELSGTESEASTEERREGGLRRPREMEESQIVGRRGAGSAEQHKSRKRGTERVPFRGSGTGKAEGKVYGEKGTRSGRGRAQHDDVEQDGSADNGMSQRGLRDQEWGRNGMEESETEQYGEAVEHSGTEHLRTEGYGETAERFGTERNGKALKQRGEGAEQSGTEGFGTEQSGSGTERNRKETRRKGMLEQEWADSHEDVSEPAISAACAFSPRQKTPAGGSPFEEDVILGSPSKADVNLAEAGVSRLPSFAHLASFSGREGSAAVSAAKAFGQKGGGMSGVAFRGGREGHNSGGVEGKKWESQAGGEGETETIADNGHMSRDPEADSGSISQLGREETTLRDSENPQRLQAESGRGVLARGSKAVTSLEVGNDVSGPSEGADSEGSSGYPATKRKPVPESLRRKPKGAGKELDGKGVDERKGANDLEESRNAKDGEVGTEGLESARKAKQGGSGSGQRSGTEIVSSEALLAADLGAETPTRRATAPKTRPAAVAEIPSRQRPSVPKRKAENAPEPAPESPVGNNRGTGSVDGLTLLAAQYENSPSPVAPQKRKVPNAFGQRGRTGRTVQMADTARESCSGEVSGSSEDSSPLRAAPIRSSGGKEIVSKPDSAQNPSVRQPRPQEAAPGPDVEVRESSKSPINPTRKPGKQPPKQADAASSPPVVPSGGHPSQRNVPPEARNRGPPSNPDGRPGLTGEVLLDPKLSPGFANASGLRPNPPPVKVSRPISASQPKQVNQSPNESSPPNPHVLDARKPTGPTAPPGEKASTGPNAPTNENSPDRSKPLETPEPSDSPRVRPQPRAKPRPATSASSATSASATSASHAERPQSSDSAGRSEALPKDSYLLSEPYRPGDSNRPGSSGRPLTAERPGISETAGRYTYSERPMSAERWVAPETPNPPVNPSENPSRHSRPEGLPSFHIPFPGMPPQNGYVAAQHWPGLGGPVSDQLGGTASINTHGYPPFVDPHQQLLAQYMQQHPWFSLPPGLVNPFANPHPNPHLNPETRSPPPPPFWPHLNPLTLSQDLSNQMGQSQPQPNSTSLLNPYGSYPNPAAPFNPFSHPYFPYGLRPSFYPPIHPPFVPTASIHTTSHVPYVSGAQGGSLPGPPLARSTSARNELLKAREIAVQRAQLRASQKGALSPTFEQLAPSPSSRTVPQGVARGGNNAGLASSRSSQPGSAQPDSAQPVSVQPPSARSDSVGPDSAQLGSAQQSPAPSGAGPLGFTTPVNGPTPLDRTSVNSLTAQQTTVNPNLNPGAEAATSKSSGVLGRSQKSTPAMFSQPVANWSANQSRETQKRGGSRQTPSPNPSLVPGLARHLNHSLNPTLNPALNPAPNPALDPAPKPVLNPGLNPRFDPLPTPQPAQAPTYPFLHPGEPLPSYDDFLDFLRFRSAVAAGTSVGLTSAEGLAQSVLASARGMLTSASLDDMGLGQSQLNRDGPLQSRAGPNGVMTSSMTFGGVPLNPFSLPPERAGFSPGVFHDALLTSAEVRGRAAVGLHHKQDSAARVIQTLWREHKLWKRDRRRREAPERRAGMLLTWRCRARFLHVRRVTIRLQSLRRGGVTRRGFNTTLWAIRTVQTAWKLFRASLSNWQRGKLRELRDLYRHVSKNLELVGSEAPSFRRFAALMERLAAVTEGAKVRRRLRTVRVKALVSEMRDIRDLLQQLEADKMKGRGTPDRQLEKVLQVQLYQKHLLLERAVHTPLRTRSSSIVNTPLPSPHRSQAGSLFGREQRGFGQGVPGASGKYPGEAEHGQRSDRDGSRRGAEEIEREPGRPGRSYREFGNDPAKPGRYSGAFEPSGNTSLRDQARSGPVSWATGSQLQRSAQGSAVGGRGQGSFGQDRGLSGPLQAWASESIDSCRDDRRQVSNGGRASRDTFEESEAAAAADASNSRKHAADGVTSLGAVYSQQRGGSGVLARGKTPRDTQPAERNRISFRGASVGFGNVPPATTEPKGTGARERKEMRSPGTSFTEQFEGPVFRTYESGFSLSPVGELYQREEEESVLGSQQLGGNRGMVTGQSEGLGNEEGFVEFEDVPYDAESDVAADGIGLDRNPARANPRVMGGAPERRFGLTSDSYLGSSRNQVERFRETGLRDGLSPNPRMQPPTRVSYDDIPITASSTPRYPPNLAVDVPTADSKPSSENPSPSEKSGRGAVKRPFLRARSGRLGTSFTIPDHFKLAIPESTRGSAGPALDSAELGPSTAPGNFGRSIFSSGRRVRRRVKRNELEGEISILEREDEGEDEEPPKRAFLQRKSKAMPMQKLDWSRVKPLVEARLNPEKRGTANLPAGTKRGEPPPLPDYKNVKSRLLAYREPNKKQPTIEEDPSFDDGDQPPVLRLPKSPKKLLGKTTPRNRKHSGSEESFGAQSDGEKVGHVSNRDRPRDRKTNRRGLGVSERREAWGAAAESDGELANVNTSMTSQNRLEEKRTKRATKPANPGRGAAGRGAETGGLEIPGPVGTTREGEENDCQVSLSPTGDLLERLYRKLRYDRGLEFSSLFPRRGGGGESVIPRLRRDADVFGDQGNVLLKKLTREGRFDNLDMGRLTFVAAAESPAKK